MITSATNQWIAGAKKLLQKKFRDQTQCYIAEGSKLVREAIERAAKIEYIIVDTLSKDKYKSLLNDTTIPVYEVESNVFASLTDAVTPQGIMAVLQKPQNILLAPQRKALVLECIQDPTNVGAILRTAAATGYNDVYMIDCADPFSPKCMRAGMSSQFCLNIFCGDSQSIFATVKQTCVLIGADMDGQNIYESKIPQNHALLLGNEGRGVSEFAQSNCDMTVSLPMQNGMESLNVAVSAGILMYIISNV